MLTCIYHIHFSLAIFLLRHPEQLVDVIYRNALTLYGFNRGGFLKFLKKFLRKTLLAHNLLGHINILQRVVCFMC